MKNPLLFSFCPSEMDPTYLNPCNHQFCFKCIQKWSRRKVICPLCKSLERPKHRVVVE
uniref:RING-type domain-containing protein n=1 Tax=Laticauda laticaudata TaxID=8630 RepID=A0A8C5RKH0_LATLA